MLHEKGFFEQYTKRIRTIRDEAEAELKSVAAEFFEALETEGVEHHHQQSAEGARRSLCRLLDEEECAAIAAPLRRGDHRAVARKGRIYTPKQLEDVRIGGAHAETSQPAAPAQQH